MLYIFIILLIYSSIYDLYNSRIPNYISLIIVILGFTYNYLSLETTGLTIALSGLFTGLVVSLIFYRIASLGAGDVKLISAIGSFVGYKLILLIIAHSYVLSACLGIVYIKLWIPLYREKKMGSSDNKPKKTLSQRIPMAPGISIATFYVMYNYPI